MIISHKNRFIFIHCPKVAGSALTVYLSRYLGPWDVRVGSVPEVLDHSIRLNARFYLDLINRRSLLHILKEFSRHPKKLPRFLNEAQKMKYEKYFPESPPHPAACQVRSHYPDAWDTYFKFCFVRNPFERVVSYYIWRVTSRSVENVPFVDFLERVKARDYSDGIVNCEFDIWSMISIDDKVCVDFIGRYENLRDDFKAVCGRIGIPSGDVLPVAKKRHESYDYRDWYGKRERRLVEEIFRKEIEYFGYQF